MEVYEYGKFVFMKREKYLQFLIHLADTEEIVLAWIKNPSRSKCLSKEREFNSHNIHTEIRIRIYVGGWMGVGVYIMLCIFSLLFSYEQKIDRRVKKSSHGTWSMKRLFYILHVGICEIIFVIFSNKKIGRVRCYELKNNWFFLFSVGGTLGIFIMFSFTKILVFIFMEFWFSKSVIFACLITIRDSRNLN